MTIMIKVVTLVRVMAENDALMNEELSILVNPSRMFSQKTLVTYI